MKDEGGMPSSFILPPSAFILLITHHLSLITHHLSMVSWRPNRSPQLSGNAIIIQRSPTLLARSPKTNVDKNDVQSISIHAAPSAGLRPLLIRE